MNRSFAAAGGYHANIMYDNHLMNRPPASRLVRLLQAPFTRRAWAELGYLLISFPLAIAGFVFTVAGIGNGPLWAVSAPGVRKLGAANRVLAGQMLGENVPAPPRLQPRPNVRVATPDPDRLAAAVAKAVALTGEGNPAQRLANLEKAVLARLVPLVLRAFPTTTRRCRRSRLRR